MSQNQAREFEIDLEIRKNVEHLLKRVTDDNKDEEKEIRFFFHNLTQEILTSENFSDEFIKQICEKHLSLSYRLVLPPENLFESKAVEFMNLLGIKSGMENSTSVRKTRKSKSVSWMTSNQVYEFEIINLMDISEVPDAMRKPSVTEFDDDSDGDYSSLSSLSRTSIRSESEKELSLMLKARKSRESSEESIAHSSMNSSNDLTDERQDRAAFLKTMQLLLDENP